MILIVNVNYPDISTYAMWQTREVALCSCFIAQLIFTFRVQVLMLNPMIPFM